MDDLKYRIPRKSPTANRPLLGMTILVVEDSRFACEALRLMCLRSGARIRRADCLASARRHLKVYRPSAVIVDMGLPDGPGLNLIAELAHATPRVGMILGMSGDDGAEAQALAAGADGFLAKPIDTLAQFQETVLVHLPDASRPAGPRRLAADRIYPDRTAYRDDIAHVAGLLESRQDGPTLAYVAQFLRGIARAACDRPLEQAASDLARSQTTGGRRETVAHLIGMLRSRTDQHAKI